MPKFSLCSDGVKWFQDKGQFKDASYVPAAGDIIFFDWGNDGSIDHVWVWDIGRLIFEQKMEWRRNFVLVNIFTSLQLLKIY